MQLCPGGAWWVILTHWFLDPGEVTGQDRGVGATEGTQMIMVNLVFLVPQIQGSELQH